MPPIYVVAGSMRSLTTGVINALVAGGSFVPMYTPGRTECMSAKFDYDGYEYNGGQELYELETCDVCRDGGACGEESCFGTFVRVSDAYAGRLMKYVVAGKVPVPRWMMPHADCGYRILFLVREYEEVRQSAGAMVSGDGTTRGVFPFGSRAQYNAAIYGALTDAIGKADDVRIVPSRYIADDPLREFYLLERSGWPIDPEKAAAAIDPSKFRFRAEGLEPGIPVHP